MYIRIYIYTYIYIHIYIYIDFFLCRHTAGPLSQSQQERIQVVHRNTTKVVLGLPTESNGTPAMDLGFENTRIRRYTNKRGIEQNDRIGTEHNPHPKTRMIILFKEQSWVCY